MKRILGVVGLCLLLAGTAGCGASDGKGGSASGDIIHGSLVLTDPDMEGGVANCGGTGGYSDLAEGGSVTVRNEDGTVVGTGELELSLSKAKAVDRLTDDGFGTKAENEDLLDSVSDYPVLCPMLFDISVKKADFYSIQIGHRSEETESRESLEKHDWHVVYSIGSISD